MIFRKFHYLSPWIWPDLENKLKLAVFDGFSNFKRLFVLIHWPNKGPRGLKPKSETITKILGTNTVKMPIYTCLRILELNWEFWSWERRRVAALEIVLQKRKCQKNVKQIVNKLRKLKLTRKVFEEHQKWFAKTFLLISEKCKFEPWSDWTVCDRNRKQRLRKVLSKISVDF